MARVLVTGGAGFIGSHLTEALVKRGDRVRVFDNFSTGDPQNLRAVENKVEVFRGDLRNHSDVVEAVQGVDVIFHEAAFVSLPESIQKPRECFDVNINGVQELLETARKASVMRIVLASSAAVYGANQSFPLAETLITDCPSPYAVSKAVNEELAKLYSRTYQMQVVALRYFNVYGPRQSPSSMYAAVIPKFIERLKAGKAPVIYGDGKQTRDFIYVDDVVRANLIAAETEAAAGQTINICSGSETSLIDLLDVLSTIFPNPQQAEFAAARLGDLPRSVGDPKIAKELLNFEAQVSLVDGLKKYVAERRE